MKLVALCLLLATTACSAMRKRPGSPTADEERAAAVAMQDRADHLERTLSAGEKAPDCKQSCDLVEEICELGRRICAISGRHVDDRDLAGRCDAATQRCQRSRDRAASRCACASPGH
jgi:hypothetical protein